MSPKVGSELAQQLGLMYFECSAKTFQGVDNPFYYLVKSFSICNYHLFDPKITRLLPVVTFQNIVYIFQ